MVLLVAFDYKVLREVIIRLKFDSQPWFHILLDLLFPFTFLLFFRVELDKSSLSFLEKLQLSLPQMGSSQLFPFH